MVISDAGEMVIPERNSLLLFLAKRAKEGRARQSPRDMIIQVAFFTTSFVHVFRK